MVHRSVALWFALAVVGICVLGVVAYRSRERWDDPGGDLFTLTVGLVVLGYAGTLGYAFFEPGEATQARGILTVVFHVLLPLAWGAFAAEQKGLQFATRRRIVGLGLAMLAGIGIWLGYVRAEDAGLLVLSGPVAPLADLAMAIVVNVVYFVAISLLVLGGGAFLHSAASYDHLGVRSAALPSIAVIAAWLHPTLVDPRIYNWTEAAALGIVATTVGVSAVGFWLTASRTNLFDHPIAAGTFGRDKVVETMEDAVVVVDHEGNVLDINPVATRLFETGVTEALGEDVRSVVGEPLPELRTADLLALETLVGVREFEPRASVITGGDGDLLGFSVVLRDVTERRTREERLAVLNRVLRHNLRNEVSVISGYAELLGETGAAIALDRAATQITDTAYELAEIGEKARTIERLMSEPPQGRREVAVADVVEQAIDPLREAHPGCSFSTAVPRDLAIAANSSVLVPVVENVVENAAEHNDAEVPQVDVRATEGVDPTTVTITVVDNGPGIPDDERTVLESGEVTPLEHGSGLGLWIAKWGITRLGGDLSFAATEPRGTIVTIRLPVDGPEVEVHGLGTAQVSPAGG